MIYIISILLVLIIAGVSLWHWGKKPMTHKNVSILNITPYFDSLYSYGYDSSFVFINLIKDERFLQFKKYVGPKGDSGLLLAFPLAEWSKEYYKKVQEVFDINDVCYAIEKVARDGVNEFIVVDVGPDIKVANKVANKVAKLILIDAFKMDEKGTVNVEYGNV